ncbi:site-specific integrase [soil metagenome]
MASIEPYEAAGGRRYRARYRDPSHRQREKGGFRTKREAEEFVAGVTVRAARGEYVDPSAGRITVGELGAVWLTNRPHLKPSTWHSLEVAWRVHVLPIWGQRRIMELQYSEIQAWVSALSDPGRGNKSATTVKRAHGILAGILDVAVRDHRISSNPARGVMLPRKVPKPRRYLTVEQVEVLAMNAGQHATLVYVLSYTGMRWGEATAVHIRAVDVSRRRIRVDENAVRVGTGMAIGTPKTHESRSVPVPRFVLELIVLASRDKSPEDLLFGFANIHLLRPHAWTGWFARAVDASREVDPTFPTVTIHDLRHTAASMAISAGANVKAVQRMLGHASAAMTLDTYADLFDDDLDAVSDRLDEVRARKVVGDLWGPASAPASKGTKNQQTTGKNLRRMGDSNPRGLAPNTLSKRAP